MFHLAAVLLYLESIRLMLFVEDDLARLCIREEAEDLLQELRRLIPEF